MVTAGDRKHPMNPWVGVALANVALFVAAGWRAAHRGDGAWWRSVVHDPVAMTVGGMVGIALGSGGAIILSKLAKWNTLISPASILLAFGFSAGVGIVFGLWPARRAAIMDPISALRYE